MSENINCYERKFAGNPDKSSEVAHDASTCAGCDASSRPFHDQALSHSKDALKKDGQEAAKAHDKAADLHQQASRFSKDYPAMRDQDRAAALHRIAAQAHRNSDE